MFSFIHARTVSDVENPGNTLGVEITNAAIAGRCGLGNVDEQHGHERWTSQGSVEELLRRRARDGVALTDEDRQWIHGWSEESIRRIMDGGRAAVEAILDRSRPRDGTVFATSRPDVDSIGAMAIGVLMGLGYWFPRTAELAAESQAWGDSVAPISFWERVSAIADADNFVQSAQWTPAPLPTHENPWPRAGSVDSRPAIAHLAVICSPRPGDAHLSLDRRVVVMAMWLLFGEPSEWPANAREHETEVAAACGCGGFDSAPAIKAARYAALASRRSLVSAISAPIELCMDCWSTDDMPTCRQCGAMGRKKSQPVISVCRCGAETPARADGERSLCPGLPGCFCGLGPEQSIAVVRVAHAGALGVGYCIAPVVVAFDLSTPNKVTIAAYSAAYLDMANLKERLNAIEPGWGGGATIVGSPLRGGTKLHDRAIVELLLSVMDPKRGD